MSLVKASVERMLDQARGTSGFLLVPTEDGFAECVLVRRDDLQLVLATWGEKKA